MGQPRLGRTIGLLDATMIGLGAMIGAGIFVASGVAADSAGSLLPLAVLIAGIPAVFNGLSAAANAVVFPRPGGTYLFARELLTPFLGFVAGWMFVFAIIVGDTAIALGFGAYVNSVLPILPVRLVGLGLVVVITTINFMGIGLVTWINNWLTSFKVGVLVFFIVVGAAILCSGAAPAAAVMPSAPAGVLEAAALLFFAYPGYGRVATLAGEVRDPRRTIPRAVLLALVIVVVLYVLTTYVAVLLVGAPALASSAAPLVVAISVTGAGWMMTILAAGGSIATASILLIDITALSRVVLAMARNGDLPGYFGQINPRQASPSRAVVAAGATIGVLVLAADLSTLIAASSFALLLYYMLTNASASRLSSDVRLIPAIVPIVGFIACLGLVVFLPLSAISLGTLVLGIGVVAYGVRALLRRLLT